MLGWNDNTETTHRSQIIKTLREVVKRAVMEFRLSSSPLNIDERSNFNDVVEAVPVSFRPPESTNMDMILSPRKRVTTLLVGETLVSFKLPQNCPFDPKDLDKLVEVGRGEAMALNANRENVHNNVAKFTFLQRLEGWKMERRQRVNGRFDMYYHHLGSRRTFRSITEVVNFFLYEVYPDKPVQKSATKSKLREDDLSDKRSEEKEKRITPLKRKMDEMKKRRVKMQSIYDLDGDNDHHHNPIYDVDQTAHDHQNPIFFDLNDDADDDQKENNDLHKNPIYDVVGDNYQEAYDQKETVEKFLAEAYNNLINMSDDDDDDDGDKKCKSFSFDINEEISEVEDGNFNPNNQSNVEELLAEAYNNLLNYSKNETKLQKEKEKRSRSIERPRRKKVKTFTPTSFPSFPNKTSIDINSNPKEKITKLEKDQKIKDPVMDSSSMEVRKAASSSLANHVKRKRFNIKELNGNVTFSEVDCETNYATTTTGTGTGTGGNPNSGIEVGKSVAFFHMDECDLINHIPESSDMFDLALFLSNNRGSNGGF